LSFKIGKQLFQHPVADGGGTRRQPEPITDRIKQRNAPDTGYTLRISTPGCNLKCVYCRTQKKFDVESISNEELLDVIRASIENGVYSLRWTGGEPTILPGFIDLVGQARQEGIKHQMLSTNGTLLYPMEEGLKEAGIERVNISLDTLDRNKYAQITGADLLEEVIRAIKKATTVFDLTKINSVLQKASFEEIPAMIEFVASLRAPKQIVLRYIELVKGGFQGDREYVDDQHRSNQQAIELVRSIFGPVEDVSVEGDNPMCYYKRIVQNGVTMGFVPNFSTDYSCGGKKCKKLRISPTGFMSNCSIYQQFGHDLKGTTYEEKVATIKHIVEEKMARGEEDFKKLRHYQTDYQFWRFGAPSTQRMDDDKGPK